MVIWTNLDHNMDQNRRCLYFYLGRSKMAKKVGFHLWTFPCTNQKASTCCASTQRWDLPFFRPVDLQCTEVKKGEINYSEILLFQASLGYF